MDIAFSPEDLSFQQDVRDFLAANLPEDIATKVKNNLSLEKEDYVRWQKILARKGWVAVNWPVEHGGTGWTPTQKYIWAEESAMAGAPEVMAFGVKMVAPIIYTFGNEEQKKRFLPDIYHSNVWWCQGYSEPNAGSDLASLKTTAVRDGDHYLINGTKTWTTLGHYADWMFCLARTGDSQTKNQEAISFFLIDMQTPGITLSPIYLLDERREVNEIHLDNVRVPAENLIGEEGKGWGYGKVLLTHERTGAAQVPYSKRRLADVKRLASQTNHFGQPLLEDPVFSSKVAEVEIELLALEYTNLRTLAQVSIGKAPGPESSILKIKGTEILQAIDELLLEITGYYSLPFLPEQCEYDFADEFIGSDVSASIAPGYFNHRKHTIFAGSNEIQKNIICKAVLGL